MLINNFKTSVNTDRNQYFFFLIGSVIILLLSSIFIFTSSSVYSDGQSCENTLSITKSYYEEIGKEYTVVVNNDLEIFPNFKNLKCLGKVNFIDDSFRVSQINTSLNKNLEYVIISLNFLLFLIARNHVKLRIFFVMNYFLFLGTLYFYKFSSLLVIFSIIFLIISLYFENNKFLNIFTIFLIYFKQNAIHKIELSSNETFYIGKIFKSDDYFSSYIDDLPTFALTFEKLIQLLIEILGSNFFIILNLCIGFLFCFYIYKILEFYKIYRIFTILFLIVLNENQSLLGNTWLYGGGIEPSTLGSLFFLISIYYLLKEYNYISIIFYSIAVYFHLALAVVLLPLYLYLYSKYIKKFILFDLRSTLLSIFMSVPLFWFLFVNNNYLISAQSSVINRYFIKERIPHHVYPFIGSDNGKLLINPEYGWKIGYLKLFAIFSFIVLLNYFFKAYLKNSLFLIVRFLFVTILIYSVVVFFFPYSNFVILTPFKITTYFIIFSLLYFMSLTSNYLYSKKLNLNRYDNLFYIGLCFYLLFTTTFTLDQNIRVNNDKLSYDPSFNEINVDIDNLELLEFVNNSPSEVVIFPNKPMYYNDFLFSFEIYSKIPTYANYKFSPIAGDDFFTWRDRLLKIETFFSGNCDAIDGVSVIYYVIINKDDIQPICGSAVFTNKTYTVFLLNN
tara:strand:+ start:9134 stop:11152 length:2019 start_codon:yes stop_codon:yes gene_type:complete